MDVNVLCIKHRKVINAIYVVYFVITEDFFLDFCVSQNHIISVDNLTKTYTVIKSS